MRKKLFLQKELISLYMPSRDNPDTVMRYWSLIMGIGERATKREGGVGQVSFFPYEKWGTEVLAMLKWGSGGDKFWGSSFSTEA